MICRFRNHIRTDRDGQTLPIVAISMVALLALMSLAIDLGMAYTARAEAQRVADAAALAGASAFLQHQDPYDAVVDARAYAADYAERNFVRNRRVTAVEPEVIIDVDPSRERVWVRVERDALRTWFARLLGINEMKVAAAAAARAMAAGTSACIMPFAIPDLWDERTGEDLNGNKVMNFDDYWYNNCHNRHGARACTGAELGEWWEYNPDYTVPEGEPYDEYRIDRDIKSWDGSTLVHASNGTATTATGLGSVWRATNKDQGLRILLKPPTNFPGVKPEDMPDHLRNWWRYWHPDGGSKSQSDLNDMIADGDCLDLAEHDSGIGGIVVTQGARTSGYSPVVQRVKAAEPYLEWDEIGNYPYDPTAPLAADGSRVRVEVGQQIVSVPTVHPEVLLRRPNDDAPMAIINIITVFLEDPTKAPFNGLEQGQSPHTPITGRILYRGTGAVGGPNTGTFERVIRLVQ
jgi:hypothetical protein